MPPTPTPIPYVAAPITMPSWDMWSFVSDGVGAWNMLPPNLRTGAQWLMIAFIVGLGTFIIIAAVRSLSSESEE